MKSYDKQRLIQNLYYFIKVTNAKVGDLESAAKVSTGYLSRWKNDGNDSSSPTVETLSIMAEKLGVSLDILLFTDVASCTKSELESLEYLNKFIKLTESEKIEWEKITISQAENAYKGGFGESVYPLPFMVDISNDFNYVDLRYHSLFDDSEFKLSGPLFRWVKHSSTIYLTCITKKGESYKQYEMYLDSNNNGFTKILNYDESTNPELGEVIENLYNIISTMSKTKIDKKVANELDTLLLTEDDDFDF